MIRNKLSLFLLNSIWWLLKLILCILPVGIGFSYFDKNGYGIINCVCVLLVSGLYIGVIQSLDKLVTSINNRNFIAELKDLGEIWFVIFMISLLPIGILAIIYSLYQGAICIIYNKIYGLEYILIGVFIGYLIGKERKISS